jgi:quinol-cytochrome oxidoreductase complex cytochrome b subunit
VLLLPVAVIALVSAHVLLVRRHGVVPPFELDKGGLAVAASGSGEADGSPEPSTGVQT